MSLFSHKPHVNGSDGSPCPQMRTLVSQLSDGTLSGIRRWYAERHTRHCVRCSGALIGLVDLETRLHALGDAEHQRESKIDASDPPAFPAALRTQIGEALDRVDAG